METAEIEKSVPEVNDTMEIAEIEQNILDAVEYLENNLGRPFYVAGSYCAYLHGKNLNRILHDFDVVVPGLTKEERDNYAKTLEFRIPLHLIANGFEGEEFENIELSGKTIPTITFNSLVKAKKMKIEKILSCKFMPEPRLRNLEKHRADLQLIKDEYGIDVDSI